MFMSDNSEEALTPKGWYLFENAVKWASNAPEHSIYEELSCPAGTTQIGERNADISGCGLEDCNARYNVNSIEDCADKCKNNMNCQSFSWAPVCGDENHPEENVCTIYNSATASDTPWGPNQILCSSPPKPTLPAITVAKWVRIYMPRGCSSVNADNWLHFQYLSILNYKKQDILNRPMTKVKMDYCDTNNANCDFVTHVSKFLNNDDTLFDGINMAFI